MLFILMIALPVLTMKLFAEERKLKTEQLLLTAPVSIGGTMANPPRTSTFWALPNWG